ncbi:pyridoxamine 5'-phosphate oxidase family protein [Spirochaetota bacterium]
MATVKVPPVRKELKELLKTKNVEIVEDISTEDFEKELVKYIDEHNVLHLSTCRDNIARSTILEYCNDGLTIYIFSEGGGKIGNIKENNTVSYTIADLYDPIEDFFSAKGLQIWGEASVFKRNDNENKFREIFKHSDYTGNFDRMREQGIDIENTPTNFNVITIKPTRMKYLNTRRGFRYVVWESD